MFGVLGLGLGVWVQVYGFRVQGLGVGFRNLGVAFINSDLGLRGGFGV